MQQTNTARHGQLDPVAIEAVIKQSFGKCTDEVLLAPKASAEAFGWLEEIFKCIKEESHKDSPDRFRLANLAGAGAYLAFDYQNFVGCEHETMVDALSAVGIKTHEDVSHG